jgi:broad specificity phosphatase PhoE
MITIVFEAHATSTDNLAGLASGWNDVELSELGEKQAKELGERYIHDEFDAIFCSDLQRSYMTAHLAFGKRFPIFHDKRLRECDYGDLTQADKKLIDTEKRQHIIEPFPGGESYTQTCARMESFLVDLAKDFEDKRVMIVGHRATQYGLEHTVLGKPIVDVVSAPWSYQPGWTYEMVE